MPGPVDVVRGLDAAFVARDAEEGDEVAAHA